MGAAQQRWYAANKDKAIKKAAVWRASNPASNRTSQKKWKDANPDKIRDGHLKRTYGITLIEYNAILASQGGRCKICRTDTPDGKGVFVVDHDHNTSRVRGLLCHGCNIGLGGFKDNPASLIEAANYLKGQS